MTDAGLNFRSYTIRIALYIILIVGTMIIVLPFFVMLKRRDNPNPYLCLRIADPELMLKP